MNSNQTQANKGNILIVDDTPENLQVLSATLSERGYKVRGVVNGRMAIRAARSASPDLILLDIRMPEMNGYEVCEHLKADPLTIEIPIIFISASDEVFDKVRAFNAGGVDYITKPFQVEEVLTRVEHQLTIRRLQKQLIQQNEQLQQEIVERKKAEEAAEAASKAKSQFLANMSHELRTPLNAILGFAQVMMRDYLLSTEQRENLRIINRSGEHLLELINDVLELSKIESGIVPLDETGFDLYQLLDGLEEMFQFKAEKKNLHLIFNVSADVPQYVKTDEKKLRACLINLLENAIKFTKRGSITLRVTLCKPPIRTDNERMALLFEVQDTGVGIHPDEMVNLFDAFVQTESGRQSAEGTGLGLTITRTYVQLMGGDITVNSTVNEGTTFQFNITIASADVFEAIKQPLRRVTSLEPGQEVYRILVVDDTQENCLLLVKLLEPIGFEVREAENGEQAVALWESWQPQLIWMDTRMPVMDGSEATRQIRAKEKSREAGSSFNPTRTIIIALTASAFEEKRAEILAAGCDDFVRKPFQEQVLFDKMAQYLGVRFIYEDLSDIATASVRKHYSVSEIPDLYFLPLMEAMPTSWVAQLYQAANEVNEEMVLQLVEQIPSTSAELAESLKILIDDFRLDRIVDLTQRIIQKLGILDSKQ